MPSEAPRDSAGVELPQPSAELVLIRVFVASYLATAPPRRAQAFLREAARILESEESIAVLLPIRAPSQYSSVAIARKQAVALFRQLMPTLVASLRGEDS